MLRTYRTPKGTELPLLNLRGREYLEVKYRLVWFREEHPAWAIETDLLSVTADSAYARASIKDDTGRVIATSHKFETKKGFPDFIEKAETGAIGRALALVGFGTQFCADELDEGDRIVDAPVDARRASGKGSSKASGSRQQVKQESASPDWVNFDQDQDESEGRRASPKSAQPSAVGTDGESEDRIDEMSGGSVPKDPGEYRISFGKKYKGMMLRDVSRSELEGYIEWLEDNASKKGLPLSEEARYLKVAAERFFGKQDQKQAAESAKH
jgi:hypothetical protein